tara:strand:- start:136 stop:333 length:198 start_codon:yes stop_codon:yes gene_type:complete
VNPWVIFAGLSSVWAFLPKHKQEEYRTILVDTAESMVADSYRYVMGKNKSATSEPDAELAEEEHF